jgi:hypothetical protein
MYTTNNLPSVLPYKARLKLSKGPPILANALRCITTRTRRIDGLNSDHVPL